MNIWDYITPKDYQPSQSKALSTINHGGQQTVFLRNLDLDHTGKFDYSRKVGTGTSASVVMAPIQWIQRSLPEAPLTVEKQVSEQWEPVEHPLTELISKPNPYYEGIHLWQATVLSYCTDGNAYWIVIRNGLGKPAQLWYAPHWLLEPEYPDDGSEFLTGYRYKVNGKEMHLDPEDVIHFRQGIDPHNLRKGFSPLIPALREIFTDMEAAEFIAALLRNVGIPGLIVSPDSSDPYMTIDQEDVDEIKNYVKRKFSGSQRGEPMIMRTKTNVERVSWNPQEMNLSAATDRSEERVCALLGIPAAVVGFSAGLEQTKVGATMEELRKLAWMNGILPLQRVFASEVNRSLMPDFRGQRGPFRVIFDTSEISALQEDRNAIAKRAVQGLQAGGITRAEYKRMIGLDPEESDEVYLMSFNIMEVPAGVVRPLPSNGNGGDPKMRGLKAEGDLFERFIADRNRRATPNQAQLRFIQQQEMNLSSLSELMITDLKDFFENELLKRIEEEAEPELERIFKQAGEDRAIADRIVDAINMPEIIPIFAKVYETHYLRVAQQTVVNMETIGLATDLPDPVARAVVATGGRRAGLVDLTQQTKRALFISLEEARAEGQGVPEMMRRIREQVPAGPWRTPETRAEVIARTETKFAQNVSTIENGKANGVEQYMVFDARLGSTDAECEALNGVIVSAQEAEELANAEHPNGSRSFSVHFGD